MIKSELLYVLMLSILCVGCSSDTRNVPEPSDSGEDYPTVQSYDNKDYALTPQSPLPTAENVDREMSEEVLKVASTTISKWYQEGYDQGYEDVRMMHCQEMDMKGSMMMTADTRARSGRNMRTAMPKAMKPAITTTLLTMAVTMNMNNVI